MAVVNTNVKNSAALAKSYIAFPVKASAMAKVMTTMRPDASFASAAAAS